MERRAYKYNTHIIVSQYKEGGRRFKQHYQVIATEYNQLLKT